MNNFILAIGPFTVGAVVGYFWYPLWSFIIRTLARLYEKSKHRAVYKKDTYDTQTKLPQ